MQVAAQVITRLLLVAALLFILTRSPAEKTASPIDVIEPTIDRDLQTVRLFAQTNGIWTDADRQLWNNLYPDENPLAGTSPASLRREAEAQLDNGEWTAAQQTINRLLSQSPSDAQLNFWQAMLLLPDPAALPYLEAAARLESDYQPAAARLLGIVQVAGYTPRDVALRLLEISEWALAERFFTLQIEQNNLDALAYAYRGFVRDQQQEAGLPDLEMAIALEPTLALPYYMLGLHYRQQEDFDASLDALSTAHLLEPNNPALVAEVAAAYALRDQLVLAEEWFANAVRLAPDDPRFALLQANFYAEHEYRLDAEGLTIIQQTAERYPLDAEIQASYGYALLQNDDLVTAGAVLEAALALAPNAPRTLFYLGQLAEKQGNTSEAIRYYLLVIQTENPYQEAAQAYIARLSR